MFIVEQPYASDLFFQSAEKRRSPVLQTEAVQEFNVNNRRLDLKTPAEFFDAYRKTPETPLYCNSENGLRWIDEFLPETDFAKKIELFKNKTAFRRALVKIYPDFYFREVDFNELLALRFEELPSDFVVKPSVGFLSLGVRRVSSENDWETTKRAFVRDRAAIASNFPSEVVDLSRFLIEETIDGEEYAVDAFFDRDGSPVVLDVLRHPFVAANDVSDRVYETSPRIVRRLLPTVETMLAQIGAATADALKLDRTPTSRPFPFHFEFRLDADGNAVPIEVNPGRFAGWHTTEIARHAFGIDVYEAFELQEKPEWDRVFADSNSDATSFFAIFERPSNVDVEKIAGFDFNALRRRFSNLFELRTIDFRKRPIAAIAFAQTTCAKEINNILKIDVADFVRRADN